MPGARLFHQPEAPSRLPLREDRTADPTGSAARANQKNPLMQSTTASSPPRLISCISSCLGSLVAMRDLERNSPRNVCRPAAPGRLRHPCREKVGRHLHAKPYAAVVLSGGYMETGDTGRHMVVPGDVLIHGRFESHSHDIGANGAEVLVIELSAPLASARGKIEDPDEIVRLCERDPDRAATSLLTRISPSETIPLDWPDMLARDLVSDPTLNLSRWAEIHGLHPSSISRAFRKTYSVTPANYRLVQRMHRALKLISETSDSLAGIAGEAGFSDQSHMTRTLRRLTNKSALQLRSGC